MIFATHDRLRQILTCLQVDLGDCIQAFASPEDNPYVQIARSLHEAGKLEIGSPTYVSETADGAYVLTWLWIPKPEQVDGDSLTMPLDFEA